MVEDIVIGAESLGFDSPARQIVRNIATAAMFHQGCVVPALSRVNDQPMLHVLV